MDRIYPEKRDSFEALLAGFSPSAVRTVDQLTSADTPPSLLARHIDVDIDRLDALSRTLKSRRNDCTPILSLPSELVEAILEACSWAEPPRAHGNSVYGWTTLGWIRLGHVCSRLRYVLLNMPTLWADVAFSFPRVYNEILPRANGVPLTIDLLGVSPADFQYLASRVRPLLHNARSIVMDFPSFKVLRQDDHLLGNPSAFQENLLSLETLNMVAIKSSLNITTLAASGPALNAPRLRHLTLENCFISCDFPFLHRLDLTFHDPDQDGRIHGMHAFMQTPSLDTNALFVALGHLTNLRTLSIRGNLFQSFSTTPNAISVSLPSLDLLRIDTKHEFCDFLLSTMTIPSHARLHITIRNKRRHPGMLFHHGPPPDTPDEDTSSTLVALVAKTLERLQAPGALPVHGVRLSCHESCLTLLSSEKGTFSGDCTGPLGQDHIPILDMHVRLADPIVLLELVHRHVHLRGNTILELSAIQKEIAPSRWRQILADFEAVQVLVLDGFPLSPPLVSAIFSDAMEWTALGPAKRAPSLPNLRALYFTTGSRGINPGPVLSSSSIPNHPFAAQVANLLHIPGMNEAPLWGGPALGFPGAAGPFHGTPLPFGQVFNAQGLQGGNTGTNTGGSLGSSSSAPWKGIVDGLRCRAQLGLGVQRVIVGETIRGVGGVSAVKQMKEDLTVVVPEVLDMLDSI